MLSFLNQLNSLILNLNKTFQYGKEYSFSPDSIKLNNFLCIDKSEFLTVVLYGSKVILSYDIYFYLEDLKKIEGGVFSTCEASDIEEISIKKINVLTYEGTQIKAVYSFPSNDKFLMKQDLQKNYAFFVVNTFEQHDIFMNFHEKENQTNKKRFMFELSMKLKNGHTYEVDLPINLKSYLYQKFHVNVSLNSSDYFCIPFEGFISTGFTENKEEKEKIEKIEGLKVFKKFLKSIHNENRTSIQLKVKNFQKKDMKTVNQVFELNKIIEKIEDAISSLENKKNISTEEEKNPIIEATYVPLKKKDNKNKKDKKIKKNSKSEKILNESDSKENKKLSNGDILAILIILVVILSLIIYFIMREKR